jgi:hypothetical protein
MANNADHEFRCGPNAPYLALIKATAATFRGGSTAAVVGQVNRPVGSAIASGATSNDGAISTPNRKPTGLVWLPR